MKDSLALLITALVASGLSWAFWSYFGTHATEILSTIFIVALGADNVRLRRQLRRRNQE
ncbi:hypothetical protein [Noviherbaspirillum aerium]|uniref:hypothetical protein n=1 Tax=Noviherbaspirillum aerium TaxID=2588497 RepID=UPI00178C61F3|nr:hypothetical protein [Noviherbaspirillum aerium]